MTTAAPIFFPGHAPCFDLHRCVFQFFHTSPALSHFRLPPFSHMHSTQTHTHTRHQQPWQPWARDSWVSGEGVSLSRTLFCVLSKTSGVRTSVWMLNRCCLPRLYMGVCVRVCVTGQSQECRTGCREKIPKRVDVKNTPWGASDCNTEAQRTLNCISRVQFTHSHTPKCRLSPRNLDSYTLYSCMKQKCMICAGSLLHLSGSGRQLKLRIKVVKTSL